MRFVALFACLIVPAAALAQNNAVPTLRTDVRLTTVDVIVTDKKGTPVRGLKADDFSVLENKQPQTIRNFEEHLGNTPTVYDPPPPGVFTNATVARGGVSNVILIDFLNTPPTDQRYLRDQLVKFLASEKPGTQTAIFTMNSSVHLLQDFTSDPNLLKLAALRLGTRFSSYTQLLQRGPDSRMQSLETLYEGSNSTVQQQISALMQSLAEYTALEQMQFQRLKSLDTMSCLHDVARYLSGVNGRKNLVWISGGFPIYIMKDPETTTSPFQGTEVLDHEMRDLQNALASNQIALYPVDPRGLPVPPSALPSEGGSTGDLGAQQRMNASSAFSPQDKGYYNDQHQEHSIMEELADATGGRAYFNTNDISGALSEASADGSQFYTLTYTPPASAKSGQFRDIDVTVKGKNLRLRYRKGYYSLGPSKNELTPLNTKKTSFNMQAMAPQSSEVLFQVEVSKPASETVKAQIIGAPVFEALPHGTYQLNTLVDFSTLQFSPDADGKMHGVVDVATVIYDKNGKVLDSRNDRATLALDATRYQAMMKSGMRYHQTVAIPDKGDGYVRVAIHDAMTDKLGTVQMAMDAIRTSAKPH
ncbi:VWA domain-containing protein [Terriglobus sp. TAA 43]|uniref:VWA domain-containing protein n=1 Tax=Terriglobus sp. TAA 43 TaxID=278961 RepID=UPI000647A3E9|nr:VWA domain-containing protein [Terriglobus sp. TAA 43]